MASPADRFCGEAMEGGNDHDALCSEVAERVRRKAAMTWVVFIGAERNTCSLGNHQNHLRRGALYRLHRFSPEPIPAMAPSHARSRS